MLFTLFYLITSEYTIWGPLRYVCGQTINPTSRICTFLESPTNLDVHHRKSLDFLAKIVEIHVADVGTQTTKFGHVAWTDEVRVLFMTIYLFFFTILVCNAVVFSFCAQISRIDVQKCKVSRLSLLVSRPWRDPFRHVCGHTNHHTTIFHTFLESLSDLDVHPGKRFALLGHYRRN